MFKTNGNGYHEGVPIEAFRNEIMGSKAPYIIVEAETGSGKSTRVPWWLYEQGNSVLVTEPLIETVIGTSEYVAELMGVPFGGVVGYRTAEYKRDSAETRILFCTDGLALVRELARHNRFRKLVIDELHMWNTNQSTLEAWAWMHLLKGDSPFDQIIVLSATLDSEDLSRERGNAPIFKVPGRQFPITDRQPGKSVEADVRSLVAEGWDVLVFEPGKAEIAKFQQDLSGLDAELIPFYADLERAQKDLAYRSYARSKVVIATNSLETGRTLLPSKGRKLAVVDSGMERRIELRDGIESLVLAPISKAQSKQRRGRGGRVTEGLYIDHCPESARPEFPTPEILRTRLDLTVLRLAVAGYDATELPFFHKLEPAPVAEAKRSLQSLGFMNTQAKVTPLGRKAAKLPVGIEIARMVLEAAPLGCLQDIVTIAAILETGSLKARDGNWHSLTQEREADPLSELDLYKAARGMDSKTMAESGIFAKNYFRAKELRRRIVEALRGVIVFGDENGSSREAILRSVVAGMVDHLFHKEGWSRHGATYRNGDTDRQIGRESVVSSDPEWVVGMPFDLSTNDRRGYPVTIHLITQVSKVDPTWLVDVAPQLSTTEKRNYRYDSYQGVVVCDLVTKFNGQEIKTEVVTGSGLEAVKAFAETLTAERVDHACVAANKAVRVEVEALWHKSQGQVARIDSGKLTVWYVGKLETVCTLAEAAALDLALTDRDVSQLLGLGDYATKRDEVLVARPDLWRIGETEFALAYTWSDYDSGYRYVKSALPIAVVATLAASELPDWDKWPIKVVVADKSYDHLTVTIPSGNLDDLRAQIEKQRLALAWQEFKSAGHGDYGRKVEVAYGEALPELSEPEMWDSVTDAQAFPAWVYSNAYSGERARTEWYLKWYQSQAEAEKARQTASAKKAELNAAEYERRNLEALKTEARALYEEVKKAWEVIDSEKYGLYGFTQNETYRYSYSEERIESRLEQAENNISYHPTQAIEALKAIQARLNEATAVFQKNMEQEPEAREWVELAKAEAAKASTAYNQGELDYSDYREVDALLEKANEALGEYKFTMAIELADQVSKKAVEVLAKAAAIKEAHKVVDDLVAREYALCPVCGGEIDAGGHKHYCPQEFQQTLRSHFDYADEGVVIKISKLGEAELVAFGGAMDRDGYYRFLLTVHYDVVVADPEKIETATNWRAPSEKEREIYAQIAAVQAKLDAIGRERNRSGRVEITFRKGTRRMPNGQTEEQLEANGCYTGTVENKGAPDGSGRSTFENQAVLFVAPLVCKWLTDKEGTPDLARQPQAGQTWLATVKFVTAVRQGKPVIRVNPQVRTDVESGLQGQIAGLKVQLKATAATAPVLVENAFDKAGEPETAMAAAFRKAQQK